MSATTPVEPMDPMEREPIAIVPVGLRVAGRRVLVVGAGRIAARKAAAYVRGGAVVDVVAPRHGPEMEAVDVARRLHRPVRPSDLDGAWLAVAATGDPAVDGDVYREAERRRIWCNAADDPEHCSAILPAVARNGPVTVAVSSGGVSPAAASWLRRRIDQLLDEPTMAVVDACARVRTTVRKRGLPTEVSGWNEVLDHAPFELAAAGGREALEHRLLDAVVGSRR